MSNEDLNLPPVAVPKTKTVKPGRKWTEEQKRARCEMIKARFLQGKKWGRKVKPQGSKMNSQPTENA